MSKKPKIITVCRSAKTGKFVTPAVAKRHPATTETERYKRPPSK